MLVCDQARVLGVCERYLSWPFIRGIAQLHVGVTTMSAGGAVAVAVAVVVDRGQILLAQNFASMPLTQKSIIILLSFLHKEIFSTPSDKCELNVLPLRSSWETLFLSMSPIPPRKQLQQQQRLIHYYSRPQDHFRCRKKGCHLFGVKVQNFI